MVGMFVKSKAGHDKNQIYMIYSETEECVYLVDGKLKTVDHPKKKSKKHVQLIHKFIDEESIRKLEASIPLQNETIKYAIKQYCNSNKI